MTAVAASNTAPTQWGQVGMVVSQVKDRLLEKLVPNGDKDIMAGVEERLCGEFAAKVQQAVCGKPAKEACDIITKTVLNVIVSEVKISKQRKATAQVTGLPICTPDHHTTCTVCLEDAACSTNGVWTQLSCGHQMHQTCLVQWAERTPSCPLCRKAI
eukprot:TRINITY_DN2280_c0_g1_i1.p1 TRINITY_DN2280_c0_g1~~TRINITY_DN2280_c0_g1_i1.p1  ORF type:complete len:157 (+),score=21.70 TRINITY_DN2280_c0_g1_i1:61-531(+)